jgi:hypothetical protein
MALLRKRKPVMLTEQEEAGLIALAAVNTSGNESELMRVLLRRAIVNPHAYGLISPQDFRKAPAPKIAQVVAA